MLTVKNSRDKKRSSMSCLKTQLVLDFVNLRVFVARNAGTLDYSALRCWKSLQVQTVSQHELTDVLAALTIRTSPVSMTTLQFRCDGRGGSYYFLS